MRHVVKCPSLMTNVIIIYTLFFYFVQVYRKIFGSREIIIFFIIFFKVANILTDTSARSFVVFRKHDNENIW